MRKYALLAAALGMSIAGVAQAGFTYTFTQQTLGTSVATPNFTGFTEYQFFAQNTQTNGTTGIQTESLVLTDAQGAHMLLRSYDNGDGTSTLDVGGNLSSPGAIPTQTTLPRASFIRIGTSTVAGIWNVDVSVPANTTAANPTFPDPTSVASFSVTGHLKLGTFDVATSPVLIAQVIVPTADTINLTGSVSDEGGHTFAAAITAMPVPEPASLSLLGIGMAGLLARRRH